MSKVNTTIEYDNVSKIIESDLMIFFGLNKKNDGSVDVSAGMVGRTSNKTITRSLPNIIVSLVDNLDNFSPIDKCMLFDDIEQACKEKEDYILKNSDDELLTKIRNAIMKEDK